MLIGGIDVGRNGWLCVLKDNKPYFYKLPYDDGKLNVKLFEIYIRDLDVVFAECPIGTNSFLAQRHQDFGEIRGITRLHTEFRWIMPSVWKKHFKLNKDKAKSIALAKELYPDVDFSIITPSGKVSINEDDDKAEALLLAHYGTLIINQLD